MNALLAMLLSAVLGVSPQVSDRSWEAFEAAAVSGDGAAAIAAAEALIEREPQDAHARFALVRAHAIAGDTDEAEAALRTALARGFVDLHRLVHDPVYEPLRRTDLCEWLFANWRERLDTRSEAEAAGLLGALGGGYRVVVDDARRVRIITALDEELTGFAREEIERVDRFAAELFPPADASRPDPWVLVLLPTPEDADRLLPQRNAGGVYDHSRKGLVVRDIGPSLRHEFFHALHWRHMERLGQFHPIWVREGLATMVEDVDLTEDELRILPSWRTNIAKRLSKIRRLRPWDDFVELSPKRFTSTKPVSNYAQARAIMHWLHASDRLAAWYRDYVDHFEADPTGLGAVEAVTDAEAKEWGEELRAWLLAQDEVGVPGRRNPVGLGLRLRPGAGDGPVVDQTGVTSDDGVRLRLRDVIRSIDGEPVRTLGELYRVLGARRAGDTVRVTLDRSGRALGVTLTLERVEDSLGF